METDPERALAVAQMIEVEEDRAAAIYETIKPLANIDPRRALETARGVPDGYWRVMSLLSVAETLAEAEKLA
jgi:hypothetical protein